MRFAYVAMLLVIIAAACGGIFAFYKYGGPLVAAQDDTVGEMLLDEGLRLEGNGAVDLALEKYRLAEKARFQGAKNAAHLHLRLAQLTENDAERMRHYEQATESTVLMVKDSALWRQAWEGRCDLLAKQGHWQELDAALVAWQAQTEANKHKLGNEQGRVAAAGDFYRGWAAEERGELEVAEQLYRGACIDGYGAPRARLAGLLHVKGGNASEVQRLREEAEVMGAIVP